MATDDDGDRAAVRLVQKYEDADDTEKRTIDSVLITICGWSLPTLVKIANGENA
jgi:hypothetical protein